MSGWIVCMIWIGSVLFAAGLTLTWIFVSWQFTLSLTGAIVTLVYSGMVIKAIYSAIEDPDSNAVNAKEKTFWVPEFCCFVFQAIADLIMVGTQCALTFYGDDKDYKKIVVVNGIAVNASLIALMLFIVIQLFRKSGCGPENACKMVNNKWYHCVLYTAIYFSINAPFAILIIKKEWNSDNIKFQLIWFAYTCLVMGIFLFCYYLFLPILTSAENRRHRMNANWICFFVVITSSILFRALDQMLMNFWMNMILQTIGLFNYLCYVNWLKANTSNFSQPDQQGGIQMGEANNDYQAVVEVR